MSVLFVNKDVHNIIDYDNILYQQVSSYIDSNNEFNRRYILELNILTGNNYKLRYINNNLHIDSDMYNFVLDCLYDNKIIKKYNLAYSVSTELFYITNIDYDNLLKSNKQTNNNDLHLRYSSFQSLEHIFYYGNNITNELEEIVIKLIKENV